MVVVLGAARYVSVACTVISDGRVSSERVFLSTVLGFVVAVGWCGKECVVRSSEGLQKYLFNVGQLRCCALCPTKAAANVTYLTENTCQCNTLVVALS